MTGKLHVYTGDGKGKTTAAMGLALRSLGHGRRVLIAQFLKDGRSGELAALRTFEQESSKEIYVVETEDGKDRIPYSDIIYFESREKKIFCCTRYREYGFYGTLEKLEQELPDHFKRCHRGYILNTAWIRKVALSENTIYLRDDYAIPVSRSYKSIMKEYRG